VNNVGRATICIASNTSWYLYNFRGRLISTLLQRGYQVCALSPADRYVERLRTLGATHVHLELNNSGVNPLRELVGLAKIATTLRRIRPSLLLTYTPKVNIYLSIAARMLNIPVVANVSGLGQAFSRTGLVKFLASRLYWLAMKHPQLVFFQNEEDKNEFVSHGLINANKVARLPGSGVDVDWFKPALVRPQREPFVFLLAARMLRDKGIAEFVEAGRHVRQQYPFVQCWLAGFADVDNPSAIPRSTISGWEKEGYVRYLGVTDDMRLLYEQVDCVVLPSYYREGVPRTLLEASSMAIPIITTDTPGCRDAVENGKTGLVCKPRDVKSLVKAMSDMVALSASDRTSMGAAGRERMRTDFDERTVIARYLSAIDRALQSS
jgi:glycosyltransferase involved in cell wall biosynthesis